MLDPDEVYFAREQLSLSQRELSRRAQVSRTALNQFELGKYEPGPNFCRKLRDFFEIEGVELMLDYTSYEAHPPENPIETPVPSPEAPQVTEPLSSKVEAETADQGDMRPVMVVLAIGLSILLGRRIAC